MISLTSLVVSFFFMDIFFPFNGGIFVNQD